MPGDDVPRAGPHRRSVKAVSASEFGEKRRAKFLEQQRKQRKKRIDLALSIARANRQDQDRASEPASDQPQAGTSDTPTPSGARKGARGHGAASQRFWSSQFLQPDWLTDVPSDLEGSWLVSPRPEGRRCLVVADQGSTVARGRSGRVLVRCQSGLPGGSRSTLCNDGATILDCIYTGSGAGVSVGGEENMAVDGDAKDTRGTFWIVDIVAWRGQSLGEADVDFRTFFVASRLAECPALGPPFRDLPAVACAPDAIRQAYEEPVDFVRDGLMLTHRDSLYVPGPTPLVLLWKDARCSRYVVDTDAEGRPAAEQEAVLRLREDGTVATEDDPPVVLARMPDTFMAQLRGGERGTPNGDAAMAEDDGGGGGRGAGAPRSVDGRLLRFAVGPGGVRTDQGGAAADLRYVGLGNQRRGRADSLSKIVFQQQARTGALVTIEDLLEAARSGMAE
ncbi:unnamed protein product [Pedinophyceae sp. YPF-701]|nr:unnamed protein product [Pedinophyceae sp. YPF-701]